jgi:hypothetical protein
MPVAFAARIALFTDDAAAPVPYSAEKGDINYCCLGVIYSKSR